MDPVLAATSHKIATFEQKRATSSHHITRDSITKWKVTRFLAADTAPTHVRWTLLWVKSFMTYTQRIWAGRWAIMKRTLGELRRHSPPLSCAESAKFWLSWADFLSAALHPTLFSNSRGFPFLVAERVMGSPA
jgi:hypothetical protein